jgi:hypothetical protein
MIKVSANKFLKTTGLILNQSIRNNSNLIKIVDENAFNLRRIIMCNEKQCNSLGIHPK